MRIFLAILFPWIAFFTIGRPFAAIFCFFLQGAIFGWPIATLWALSAVGNWTTDRKIAEAMLQQQSAPRSSSGA